MKRENTRTLSILPVSTYGFIDVIRVWLCEPLTDSEIRSLRPECGGVKMRVHNWPKPFDPRYSQRLTIFQPSRAGLELLAKICGLHTLTYVEVSLDWIFANEEELEDAFAFVRGHVVKLHHRDQQIRFVNGVTRYTGPRTAPQVIAAYGDKPSRITGEINCLHIDYRMRGVDALKSAGICQVHNLLSLNQRQFWRKRLRLYEVDRRKLGRLYNNSRNGSRRRAEWVKPCGRHRYSVDLRTGGTIWKALGSVQEIIDTYRKCFRVNRCLTRLDVSHLLP